MAQFVFKHSEISCSNIVLYVKNKEDLTLISFLSLPENILGHIGKHIEKKESSFHEYIIAGRKYEKLSVFIDKEKIYEKSVNFLGKHFPKMDKELCLFAKETEKLNMLYEVCELSRYSFQNYKNKKREEKNTSFLPSRRG